MLPSRGPWHPTAEQIRRREEIERKRDEDILMRLELIENLKCFGRFFEANLAERIVKNMDSTSVKIKLDEFERHREPAAIRQLPSKFLADDAVEKFDMSKYNIGTQNINAGTVANNETIAVQNIYLKSEGQIENKKVKLELKNNAFLISDVHASILKKFGRMMDWKMPDERDIARDFYNSISEFKAFDNLDAFLISYKEFLAARPLILEAHALDNTNIDESINTRFSEIASHFIDLAARVGELKMAMERIEALIRSNTGNIDASKK